MDFIKKHRLLPLSALTLAIAAGNASAGGFEKATLWDAKYSALAGAAVSSVDDSSAIFFNPAGLAFAESNDVALHLSPTFTEVNGPAAGDQTYVEGETNFVPSSGFTGLYKLNDKLTLGYGVYAAGGSSASYKNVTVGQSGAIPGPGGNSIPISPVTGDYSTKINVIEAGLGMAYRINNNWSVGGTYRITYATADINLLSATGSLGASVGYQDLSGTQYFGVRLGTMYRSDDNRFGWGMNFRSKVEIEADGDYKSTVGIGSGTTTNGKATAETQLPMQISTGVDYALTNDWTVFGEVTYSNYEAIDSIKFTSSDNTDLLVNQINTDWNDQYNIRIAGEYTGIDGWALRGGYILTTAVVPEELAAPTFSTPANAHTLTLGAGTSIMNDTVDLDFAAEYNYVNNDDVSGGGTATDSGTPAPGGKYRTSAYAFHVSAKYKF